MLIRLLLFVSLTFVASSSCFAAENEAAKETKQNSGQQPETPNVVIIFTDDQGYSDIGCFGAKGWKTPRIDSLAADGIRFTNFYVAQAVCSASRTALLTGCYPNRIGILGALGPQSRHGINANEMTIAELLKQRGYATGAFGKWHLGHHPEFLPTRHGFDEYFGLPYSNDMWPYHPERPGGFPPLPLIDGETVTQYNPDQHKLTTWYTERAVKFIDKHHEHPFFLYLAHSMPHVPLYVSDKYQDSSEQGMYGDVIQEIDWSVGQVLDALDRNKIADNTLVIFTTDNGPWLSYGDHAGTCRPLREGKGTTFEGGQRVPCVMRWPGHIPAGRTCDEVAGTWDVLPTLAEITGTSLPDHDIDGRSIWPLLSGQKGATSPHEAIYYYWGAHLQAIRSGRWKLHFPHNFRTLHGARGGTGGIPVKYGSSQIGLSLFDLESDIGETKNVAAENPEVVARLQKLADQARAELGDSVINHQGDGLRPAGQVAPVK